MSESKRFQMTNCNDPRGKHWSLWDSLRRRAVCARAWKEEDIIKLAEMHNNGSIEPNYENRYINHDVEIHLTASK